MNEIILIDKKCGPVLNKAFKSRVLKGRDQLSRYAAQLDRLFSETLAPSAVRWPLLESWLLYNPKAEPMGVLIWDGHVLVAAGLFALKHKNGFCKITKIGVEGEPYWLSARNQIASERLGEALINALQEIKKPWFLYLTDIPDNDPVIGAINARLNLTDASNFTYSPQLRFDRQSGLNRYLSQNTRSAVAKAKNRIKRDGLALDMRWSSEVCQVEESLEEIIQVHRARNRLKRGLAILDNPSEAALFRESVLSYARAEKIRLLTLRLNGALAAFSIGVLDRDMLWIYANLVSPDWLRYSAGTIINAEVVRSAYDDPSIKGVNWGEGLQRYKLSGDIRLVPSIKLMGWSSWPARLAWQGSDKIRQESHKIRRFLAAFVRANRNQGQHGGSCQSEQWLLYLFGCEYAVGIQDAILSLDTLLSLG